MNSTFTINKVVLSLSQVKWLVIKYSTGQMIKKTVLPEKLLSILWFWIFLGSMVKWKEPEDLGYASVPLPAREQPWISCLFPSWPIFPPSTTFLFGKCNLALIKQMNPRTVPDSIQEFQTRIKHDIQGDYNPMKETVVYTTNYNAKRKQLPQQCGWCLGRERKKQVNLPWEELFTELCL